MRLLVVLCAMLICDQSQAQSTSDLVKLSEKSYAAFECAALASTANFSDEQARLFKLGYEQGKVFLQAYADGKIKDSDVEPIGFWGNMHDGPNIDFKLGVIWASAYRNTHEDIWKKPDGSNVNIADWTDLAILKFTHQDCRSLL
ncbi:MULTISPECIES: hypothetical protein [unclassified Mesorhizobium]|uniref:hypothetical protein n=1 Tax=unclassified Mesorhizobium TaxID=325217 RepID=UPI001092DE87|nr:MULTISPECIES: hypothetical protein [unclassified Mesorhizobium]TGP88929.1 hypothetical protein EN861_27095 [Mesorhizobium sp. M8A.F.Ca.ET.218.01.1.1]TGT16089.1 hypothetical protein EN856_26630 [Mesorhizobium sp. M8A.F.Ca.ET.213.01.1.1]